MNFLHRFTYQAVVYEGKGVNKTIPPLVTLDSKEPPILLNPDRLAGLLAESMFTVGVRLKTVDVIFLVCSFWLLWPSFLFPGILFWHRRNGISSQAWFPRFSTGIINIICLAVDSAYDNSVGASCNRSVCGAKASTVANIFQSIR